MGLSLDGIGIKWGARKRLEFIEKELFWSGRVSRQTMMEKTGISKAQASADLALYKKLAGENLFYDLTEKTYLVATTFIPLFINISPQVYLVQLALDGENSEQIPLPSREIDLALFRAIVQAVKSTTCIEITYQSMSSPYPKPRIIAPHSFVSDGWRWHIRAYDFLSASFRDFLLARMLSIQGHEVPLNLRDIPWSKDNDAHWTTMVPLRIVPHPGLSSHQKAVVATDFGMVDGEVFFPVRRACLFYTLRRLRLLDELINPAEQQIVLYNKDEIIHLLNEPENHGGDLE